MPRVDASAAGEPSEPPRKPASERPRPSLSFWRSPSSSLEQRAAAQLRHRRAITVGYAVMAAFSGIDWMVVRHLGAPSFAALLVPRLTILALLVPVLVRLYRRPPLRSEQLSALDLLVYGSASVVIALMSTRFNGLASPYVPGLCLVLLARSLTAEEPWPRGLLMSGVPIGAFYVVLLGSALVLPEVRSQFHEGPALAMLVLNSAYVLGTYTFVVVGGHIVWLLRRQVFEARDLGKYRLKRRLASGGMGEVWAAYHPGLKREVAVKILRNEVHVDSEVAVQRFEREARATAELLHPNTVRVFDYGATEDGLFYYVMELLEGETLAEHVERLGAMSPVRAVYVIGQAARALAEAHARGIVHRDIKPQNLFLTSLGGEHDFVKVLDFGIAKVAREAGASITGTGWILGTPVYMSPEVVSGKEADARSDVYALGAVLYFLLSGKAPFESANPSALVFAQVNRTPEPPSRRLGRPLPEDLEALTMRTLRKDPLERFATAAELAQALATCEVAGRWTLDEAVYVGKSATVAASGAAAEPADTAQRPLGGAAQQPQVTEHADRPPSKGTLRSRS